MIYIFRIFAILLALSALFLTVGLIWINDLKTISGVIVTDIIVMGCFPVLWYDSTN